MTPKTKKSTLFPSSWTDKDILNAINQVGSTKPVAIRISDKHTLYRDTINGVQIEVIKHGKNVTSAYPTGGTPSANF